MQHGLVHANRLFGARSGRGVGGPHDRAVGAAPRRFAARTFGWCCPMRADAMKMPRLCLLETRFR